MDGYRLLRSLACGGMATVWLAEHRDRLVAIKRIHPAIVNDVHVSEMFAREAEIASRFAHRNIVEVYETGRDPAFIAMELVRGFDLAALMACARAVATDVPVELSAYVIRELCFALAHVHGHGVVHCDVSPRNVLVSNEGDVKLTDFGVARSLGHHDESTRRERAFGKAGYIAPERLRGAPWTKAADLWSAGVILYELLSGTRLFRAKTFADTLALVDSLPIVAPSIHNPAVPHALDAVVLALLERDPRYRVASARIAAEMLLPFADVEHARRRLAHLTTELATASIEEEEDAQPTLRDERLAA